MRWNGWIDFDTDVYFKGKDLSFYQEFFNYWYIHTLDTKLKNDFSSHVWDIGEESETVEEFWKRCEQCAQWQSEDLIDPRRICDGDLRYDFINFANFKINQEVGRLAQFYCNNQYLQHFVMPECYRLARDKVGTLENALDKEKYLEYAKECYPFWILEDYRDSIVTAMCESFAKTKYASEVQKTLKERYDLVAKNAIIQFKII
jgi:hypothetical protein